MVRRIYVEKKPDFAIEARALDQELREDLHLEQLKEVRVLNRYDVAGIDESTYHRAKYTVFAEPAIDCAYDEVAPLGKASHFFAVEYLPGQYDQRADSAEQCIRLMDVASQPQVRFARVYLLEGKLTEEQLEAVKSYCINPVDSREAQWDKPESLTEERQEPDDIAYVDGFLDMSRGALDMYQQSQGFAMTLEDLVFVQSYFQQEEKREPSVTELKVIDTYWSDHCRHTTFLTEIEKISFDQGAYAQLVQEAYHEYLAIRKEVYGDRETKKDICLMDLAVIGAKYLKKRGLLEDLDESDEINACSIKVKAVVDGKEEDWLVMFKNETHNHPTEIEPFGGAATCLGGAIRDPLSGRVYVYQAMRVTGSGDPRTSVEDTLPGKLPQRKITRGAARGYSSYGNQIGLATGQVAEIYHEGYVAKRMEVGAVIGAAPADHVVRMKPEEGDVIVLVGGRTGRDGCGGATGSSKEHTEDSILVCGAEVQKGNPPVERNIQRLFRRPEAAKLIKKCNDFGAGGVSVAIGELAESIDINLDLVLKKYEGLDGTELAISESQERMAVVVTEEDRDRFIQLAGEENLEAVAVAEVTDTGRFRMFWRGSCILNLARTFLDSNGAKQKSQVTVKTKTPGQLMWSEFFGESCKTLEANNDGSQSKTKEKALAVLADLRCANQKGLIEQFDSTIGAGTVLMPLGGIYQQTPAPGMAAKLPVSGQDTETTTLMSFGFDPDLSLQSPFHGALYAVIDAVTKIVAMGGDYRKVRLSFQEYFPRLGEDPERWAKPLEALLGALKAQKELELPAIGGKDSMSGTFLHLDVPPTLIAFAVGITSASQVMSPEIKKVGSKIIYLALERDQQQLPDFSQYRKHLEVIHQLAQKNGLLAAATVGKGGVLAALAEMCMGNRIGAEIRLPAGFPIFDANYGSLLLEVDGDLDVQTLFEGVSDQLLGTTQSLGQISMTLGEESFILPLAQISEQRNGPLASVFPTQVEEQMEAGHVRNKEVPRPLFYRERNERRPVQRFAKPQVYIPVFPGTNCEMDTKCAFEKAGAVADVHVLRNGSQRELADSIKEMAERMRTSQMIAIPGGFSGGDEPDGSAKFITAVFRNPEITEEVTRLLEQREGLMLGICNGFQALIKLGLVPYGKIIEAGELDPTLTYNRIGRHVSCLVRTRIASVKSPWLAQVNVGDIHTIPVSHGEGRVIINDDLLHELIQKGQIATQYVNLSGEPTLDIGFNPNGSVLAIEAMTSPDGRIMGKMGHSERIGENLYKNIPGNYDQKIFASGVAYFK